MRGTAQSRHTDLGCDLSKALRPGHSVSGVEPSGVCFSWYCQPSSRSLGHSLLLGQKDRLNFFSDLVRSLFHQHHRRPHTEFVSHRHNRDPRTEMARMFFGHGAKEFSQLAVLANRRPRSLDKLTAQSSVTGVSNRAPLGFFCPGGVLSGDHPQKSRQLANAFPLPPIPNAGQQLTGDNPADAGNRFQILDTLRQFRIGLTEAANLSGGLQRCFSSNSRLSSNRSSLKRTVSNREIPVSPSPRTTTGCQPEPEETPFLPRATAI